MPNISLSQVNNHFRNTIPLMVKHSIPVTPAYYALWYAYVTKQNPELTERMGAQISQGINRHHCDELISRYMIAPVENKLLEMQASIKTMVSSLGDSTETAMASADNLSESLSVEMAALAEDSGAMTDPRAKGLVKHVNAFMEKTSSYREQLAQQTEEIRLLKQRIAETERQSYLDGLTGIFNRRKFNEDISMLSSTGCDTCMIIVDIDHFKPFNDEYGHLVGDKVLQSVAQTLQSSCDTRPGAQAYRFGGEEFAIILPETELPSAQQFAENVRLRVSRLNLTNKKTGVTLRPVTTSLGIAQLQRGETPENLINRADQHLYAAKAAGRNCVRPLLR